MRMVPPARTSAVKLLHGADHVGDVLDDVNGQHAVERVVGERVGEAVEVAQDVGAAGGIAVDPDGAGMLADPAADVERSQVVRTPSGTVPALPRRNRTGRAIWSAAGRAVWCCLRRRAPARRARTPPVTIRSRSSGGRFAASPGPSPARCRSSAPARARRPPKGSAPASPRMRSIRCAPMRAAFSTSPCSSSSMVASAAAQATGLPPKVEACAPGGQLIRSARATVAPSGMPLAMPLATAKMSGTSVEMLRGPHLARCAPCPTALRREPAGYHIARLCAATRRRTCAAARCSRLRPAPAR